MVGVTKTEPLTALVWESDKDLGHERQKMHDGRGRRESLVEVYEVG